MSRHDQVPRRHSSDSKYGRRELEIRTETSRRGGSPTHGRVVRDLSQEYARQGSGSPGSRSNILRFEAPSRRSLERSSPIPRAPEPTTRVPPELAGTLLECEKSVVAFMANLRHLSTFPFPIEFPREPITWKLLVECLHRLYDLGSRDLEVAKRLGHKHEAKAIEADIDRMKVRLESIESLYPRLPQHLIVDEERDRLQLRSARVPGKAPPPEYADAATQDDPTCIRGLRLLMNEFADLRIVTKSYTPAKAPTTKENWLSTLDSMEEMLTDHKPKFRGRTPDIQDEEQTLWLRKCIRIRGWIVSARRKQGLPIR